MSGAPRDLSVEPFWTDIDGSRVKAKLSGETDAPIDSVRDIKWLRLEAVENSAATTMSFIRSRSSSGCFPRGPATIDA
jgi:hypothetical protein